MAIRGFTRHRPARSPFSCSDQIEKPSRPCRSLRLHIAATRPKPRALYPLSRRINASSHPPLCNGSTMVYDCRIMGHGSVAHGFLDSAYRLHTCCLCRNSLIGMGFDSASHSQHRFYIYRSSRASWESNLSVEADIAFSDGIDRPTFGIRSCGPDPTPCFAGGCSVTAAPTPARNIWADFRVCHAGRPKISHLCFPCLPALAPSILSEFGSLDHHMD